MKKIVLITTLLFTLSFALVPDEGDGAANANSTNVTKGKGYTNQKTGKTYKDVKDISSEERTKLKAPFKNLFKSTQWSLFLQEFEIKWKLGECGKGWEKAWGFKAHLIEPIGYMEVSKKPLYFPFADLDLGGKTIKSCQSRADSREESTRDNCQYQHFIFAPIMGMIFKKSQKFICFHPGKMLIPVISEFLPNYLVDTMDMKLIPHILAMVSPQAIVSSIINCGATMGSSFIRGYATNQKGSSKKQFDSTEWAEGYTDPSTNITNNASSDSLVEKGLDKLTFIRNTMYYNLGCLGMHPVGGYIRGIDPGVDASLLAYGTISKLHGASALTQVPILQKQTNFGMQITDSTKTKSKSKILNTMCAPRDFAIPIESQYVVQRAYPTVGEAKEFGETPMTLTPFANVPGSKDNYVDILWMRRDYYAGAYKCGKSKKKK